MNPIANRMRVLVTPRGFNPGARAYLEEQGFAVRQPELNNTDPAPDTLPDLLDDVDGWILGSTFVGHDLMARFPRLKVLARRGVGFEQIDHLAAARLGKVVTIAAGGNSPSVADHTIGLMLAVAKRLATFPPSLRTGDWTYRIGEELTGSTVGIVGLGRIGRCVARRLGGFDVRILATDIVPDDGFAAAHRVTRVDLDMLLSESDFVTLHAPLDASTAQLIDRTALARMKPGAIFINTARGGLVNERDLYEAIVSGHIAGAGLDVFEAEKDPAASKAANALIALERVVATPHTAAATYGGLARTNLIAARTVVDILTGRSPPADCIVADGRSVLEVC
ncbi:D-3-phosphoglycerate dehydrogenase [Methylobacterium pseudosasicola]|uniref:D-3-phosphoglycerate dehydrogenase n=2 Tax=Methylobacterium pseudosasicola TaxID=582667 RepID=A0A1I4STI6_9HYPH|nr:D-3-phosphoglycerate dehydrogenase [Methylobacterium pseudosasicola]